MISYAPSNEEYSSGFSSYTAKLMNKCSIIKVNATLPDAVAVAPICITGMNNKVTVHFDTPTAEDNGFEYGIDGEGVIKMPAKDADNVSWAIVLPQAALEEGEEGSAYTLLPETIYNYYSSRPQVHEIESNKYYSGSDDAISLAITTNRRLVDFTYMTSGSFQEQDYDIYTGELGVSLQPTSLGNNDGGWGHYTLKDATIHENLDCSGNVVLTLKGNNVIGCEDRFFNYAGLGVNGASYNGNQYYTLVIDGDGSLVVSGGYDWPGIGSCVQSCGNIEIRGGHITAIGDGTAPGIGAMAQLLASAPVKTILAAISPSQGARSLLKVAILLVAAMAARALEQLALVIKYVATSSSQAEQSKRQEAIMVLASVRHI